MKRSDDFDELFEDLRVLAAEDPRGARKAFSELLDSNSPHVERVIQRASLPSEGRLRQLIAHTARLRGEQERFDSNLAKWLDVETDEFTRRALEAARAGTHRARQGDARRSNLAEAALVDAYRYVGDRLKHQLRNAFMNPLGHLVRLSGLIETIPDAPSRDSLAAQIAALKDAIAKLGRIVEIDSEDGRFVTRSVHLEDWLTKFNTEYGAKFEPIQMTIVCATEDTRIQATEYHLGILFWNLWINSQQAVGRDCKIVVQMAAVANQLQLILVDNGDGLPSDVTVAEFPDAKPRPGHRGRGLLEVQEAIERLQGHVELVRHTDGTYRIRLGFPLERP